MRLSGQLLLQRLVDQRIKLELLAHHARRPRRGKRCLGRGQILRALDLAAEPVTFEFRQDLVQAGAGEVHLVERLHRRQPGRAALIRLAGVLSVERRLAGRGGAPLPQKVQQVVCVRQLRQAVDRLGPIRTNLLRKFAQRRNRCVGRFFWRGIAGVLIKRAGRLARRVNQLNVIT